jgi:TatD DNase family protein
MSAPDQPGLNAPHVPLAPLVPPDPPMWIDTHCHLDAPEFNPDRAEVIARARQAGVGCIVVPSVSCKHFDATREAAHVAGGAYALGIHPLYVHDTPLDEALACLDDALSRHRADPRLVAVGEIGLDHFVPAFNDATHRALQQRFYLGQLKLAHAHGLPVILHVRRSADALLAGLRRMAREGRPVAGGIAHAFNGSTQQAQAFVELGFKLGFGGTLTFERALQIRRLASSVADDGWVLETDAPDIPPQWRYLPAQARLAATCTGGIPPWRNEPSELPRIAAVLSHLRGQSLVMLAHQQWLNVHRALPRLMNIEHHVTSPASGHPD